MFFLVPDNLLSSCACSIQHHFEHCCVTSENKQGWVEMSLCKSGFFHSIQMSALMTALIMQSTQCRWLGMFLNAHQHRQSGITNPTVCTTWLSESACSPNHQSPFLSPSRASWIKMDKHFLWLISASAGAHLINFLISLGTNDLRDLQSPNSH